MRVGAGEGDPSGMGAVHGDCSPSVSGSPAWSLQGYMALTVPPLCPWDGKQHPIHPSIRACLCPHSLHALGWCCLLHGLHCHLCCQASACWGPSTLGVPSVPSLTTVTARA